MPIMYLNTNLQDKDIPKNFERELCEKVGEILKKPLQKITLTIHTGVRQMRAGTADSMVSLDIHSIGVFDQERNPRYTTALLQFLCEKLHLPQESRCDWLRQICSPVAMKKPTVFSRS